MSRTARRKKSRTFHDDDVVDQGLPFLTPVRSVLRQIQECEEEEDPWFLNCAEVHLRQSEIWALNAELVGASGAAAKFRRDAAEIAEATRRYRDHCVTARPEGADA